MATLLLNGHGHQGFRQLGRVLNGRLSDEEDGVQSGSATGFSDGDRDEVPCPPRQVSKFKKAVDPVTKILDKIDAELSSLTRSQGSSSTATDSTVVLRPNSVTSTESSRLENGNGLSLSQLGSSHQSSYAPRSSSSHRVSNTDKDTGIGTGTSSFRDNSRDDLDPSYLQLEPGDDFKDRETFTRPRSVSPPRRVPFTERSRSLSPEMMFLNNGHIGGQSDDDKSKQEKQQALEAKQVDDKFREILQKRKGGHLSRGGGDEDTQTIRTEDFGERFQDALVYTSDDQAERVRQLDDDLRSDGGSDTDTLQQKLVSLTSAPFRYKIKDGGGRRSPRPVACPLERSKRKFVPSSEGRQRKAGGTPPVYPKPTPTTSLPRPSARTSFKFSSPGHGSDADSVRTEDFENSFKDMIVSGNQTESDFEPVPNDPIHAKVKQLLQATAKYGANYKTLQMRSRPILKTRSLSNEDKPKSESRQKHHVRISSQPTQYQDKGEDSDDTLCSDKEDRVPSPRQHNTFGWFGHHDSWDNLTAASCSNHSGIYCSRDLPITPKFLKSSSLDDSLSKSSVSLSSGSSTGKLRQKVVSDIEEQFKQSADKLCDVAPPFVGRQSSYVSSASSNPSTTSTDFPETSTSSFCNQSSCSELSSNDNICEDNFHQCCSRSHTGQGNRKGPSVKSSTKTYTSMNARTLDEKSPKTRRKPRDLILQDEEEEEFPFAKYTFNKKKKKDVDDDSSSSKSRTNSFSSVGVVHQFKHLQETKRLTDRSSSSSLFSSVTSSGNTDNIYNGPSVDDSYNMDSYMYDWNRQPRGNIPDPYQRASTFERTQNQGHFQYGMYSHPHQQVQNSDRMLNSLGFEEARSILPERFLWSWIEKVVMSQQEEYARRLFPSPTLPVHPPAAQYMMFPANQYYVEDTDLPPSVSAQHSGASTPRWRQSLENIYQQPSNMKLDQRRNQSKHMSQNSNSSMKDSFERSDLDYTRLQSMKRENSFDKLRRILQSTEPVAYKDKDIKRSSFASSRQKSLPIFLDTLSEEDEEKRRSRTPSIDKSKISGSKDSNMKTFFEEEERVSLRASSSEELSDINGRCTFELGVSSPIIEIYDNTSNRSDDSCSDHTSDTGSIGQKLTVPYIVVSEKEIEPTVGIEPDSSKSKTGTEEVGICRPVSPNPDTQPCQELNSKDSLEVAEILCSKEKVIVTPVLAKIESMSSASPEERSTQGISTSFHFLSPTGNEMDDKYLSPTPSISSPQLMSPVTVIEVNKLDNQNDSLDNDDQKSRNCMLYSIEENNNKEMPEIVDMTAEGRDAESKQELQNQNTLTGCTRNCHDNLDDCQSLGGLITDSSLQVDMQSLSPLLKFTDVTRLVNDIFCKHPQNHQENIFYLAQDRGVQCTLEKEISELTKCQARSVEPGMVSTKGELSTATDKATDSYHHSSRADNYNGEKNNFTQTTSSQTEEMLVETELLVKFNEYLNIVNEQKLLLLETRNAISHVQSLLESQMASNGCLSQSEDADRIEGSLLTKGKQSFTSEAFIYIEPGQNKLNYIEPAQNYLNRNMNFSQENKPEVHIHLKQKENDGCLDRTALKCGPLAQCDKQLKLQKDSKNNQTTTSNKSEAETKTVNDENHKSSIQLYLEKLTLEDDGKKIHLVDGHQELDPLATEAEFFNWLDKLYSELNIPVSEVEQDIDIDDIDFKDLEYAGIIENQCLHFTENLGNGASGRQEAGDDTHITTANVALLQSDIGRHRERHTFSSTQKQTNDDSSMRQNSANETLSITSGCSQRQDGKHVRSYAQLALECPRMLQDDNICGSGCDSFKIGTYNANNIFRSSLKTELRKDNDHPNSAYFDNLLMNEASSCTVNSGKDDIFCETYTVTDQTDNSYQTTANISDRQFGECNPAGCDQPENDSSLKKQDDLLDQKKAFHDNRAKRNDTMPEPRLDGLINSLHDTKLSTRSLDFDSQMSRRFILKRCRDSPFSKSFENGPGDASDAGHVDSSFIVKTEMFDFGMSLSACKEKVIGAENMVATVDASSSQVRSVLMLNYSQDCSVEIIEELCDDNIVVTKSMADINTDIQGLDHDTNLLTVEYGMSDDEYQTLSVCQDVNFLSDLSKEHANDQATIENFVCNIEKRSTTFDMFASIEIDDASLFESGYTDLLVQTNKAAPKPLDQVVNICNGTVKCDQCTKVSQYAASDDGTEVFPYDNRLKYYEQHLCKNCGHMVAIATEKAGAQQVEHDFCHECSPLNLTAEMLERRRIQRMNRSPTRSPTRELDTRDDDADTRREIARETDRIRREIERERHSKSPRDRSPTRTYLTVTASPRTLQSSIQRDKALNDPNGRKSLSDEEKERSAELKATKGALELTQSALLEPRKGLKETQSQFEDARTQLMLFEYKRENVTKELARLSEDLKKKQHDLRQLDNQMQSRRSEMEQFNAIGFTKDEAMKIIEANESMKSRLRNVDAVHAERDELIQQLETTKQDLFNEQKKARNKIEELQDELENSTMSTDQYQTELDEMKSKLQKLEASNKKMEKEKNELIQEKTRLYEEERDKNKSERSESRKRNIVETDNMRTELVQKSNQMSALQDDVRHKEALNHQLRDQILDLQQKLEQNDSSRNFVIEEQKKTLQTLRKETDAAMVQLRESLFLEKQKTVNMMREELEHERREIAARAEQRYETQLNDQASIIKAKSEEISHLVRLVDKLEKDQDRNKVKIEDEVKLQVQEAVLRERKAMEQERDWSIQQEKEELVASHRQDMKQQQQQVDKAQDEMGYLRKEKQALEVQLKSCRKELDDVKASSKAAVHEKLIAVARAKEQMRLEHQSEVDRIREQLKNEHKQEVDRLRETIMKQEDELRSLREDRLRSTRQQKEQMYSSDKFERTLINEINDECRKTSEILGLSPRRVNINSTPEGTYRQTNNSKPPTTSALPQPEKLFLFTQAQEVCKANEFKILTSPRVGSKRHNNSKANLRACNEELRSHVSDLQSELDTRTSTLNLAAREKDEALLRLRKEMEQEKEEEMSRLKEKLVRGLSTNEYRSMMYSPDNEMDARRSPYQSRSPRPPGVVERHQATERHMRAMSEQQQLELERLEREINKLAMSSGPGCDPQSVEDVNYVKNVAQLQSKVKQLQTENSSLRRIKLGVASSTPDLSNPDIYNGPNHRKFHFRSPSPTRDQQRMASNLELRMREHDYETEALTEHQRHNRDIMSKKMSEMTKLQNTLTNQAKELIQLEKSYTQLNQYAKTGRPMSSLR